MDVLARIYPKLEERYPLPKWWVPGSYVLFALTPLVPGLRARLFTTVPVLVMMVGSNPFFTVNNVTEDYGNAFPILAMTLSWLDFFLLTPAENSGVRFMGQSQSPAGKDTGVSEDHCDTIWKKFKWGCRLSTSMRGIGWSWQVKGVPDHPKSNLSRGAFVFRYLALSALSWVYKMACLYLIGVATGAKLRTNTPMSDRAFDVVVGWCGASWAYNGLNRGYRLGAATSVALGLCDQWEWPPLFGSLSDGWSVRQMWR